MCAVNASYPQILEPAEPGACHVLLVRHGQSAPFVPGQPFDCVDGHGDPHLTALGHHQATLVAGRLAAEPITGIYVSNLTRTHQTAAPLADGLGLVPVSEPDLREVLLGEAEGGLLRQMAAERHPLIERMREIGDWGVIPGAETNLRFQGRTVGAVAAIAARHPDQMVAVFCHGGVIGAVLSHAVGAHPFTFRGSRHTAISHLVVGPGGWTVRSFNDSAHVGPLTADHQLPPPPES